MERLVLMVNHVIAAEPVATEKLKPHAGRSIRFRFDGWPSFLPAPPSSVFRVTPAGLFEAAENGVPIAEDLLVGVDTSNPALVALRLFTGERPTITVAGDAGFAADVNWLFDNLRWDIEDDLAKLIGDAPARELARFAAAVDKAMRKAAGTLRGFGAPDGSGTGGPPAR